MREEEKTGVRERIKRGKIKTNFYKKRRRRKVDSGNKIELTAPQGWTNGIVNAEKREGEIWRKQGRAWEGDQIDISMFNF